MASHNELGKYGEELGGAYLQENSFRILHRNWRYSYYEIDVVCSRESVLHFVEIKTRRTVEYGLPEDSVTKKKVRQLIEAGTEYHEKFPYWKRVQYDILSINIYPSGPPEYFLIEDVYL